MSIPTLVYAAVPYLRCAIEMALSSEMFCPGYLARFILTTWAFQSVSDVSFLLPHPPRSGNVLGLSLAYLFLLHTLTLPPPRTLALSAALTCSP